MIMADTIRWNALELHQTLWGRVRVAIISLFVLFHLMTLILWITPPFPLYWSILPPFRHYICQIGFWNTWTMFSHPKKFNAHLIAHVTLTDGRVVTWDLPRMEKLGYWERAQKERYRKWTHEYVNEPAYSYVLPETCA